jgi:uncharacterized protein
MVEVAGEYEIAAPRGVVWDMVFDPDVLIMTIAGCEELERVDENTLQGRLNIRVGPVQGVFRGKVETQDIRPPASFHMIVSGNGPAGAVRGEGNVMLEDRATGTLLRYDGAVQVSGRIASVGQRVMDSSTKSIVRQSLQNLEKQIEARLQPQPEPESGAAAALAPAIPLPAVPGQTEFMVNVARDVLNDLVPETRQRSVLVSVGLAALVIGLMNAFANLVARRVVKMLQEE